MTEKLKIRERGERIHLQHIKPKTRSNGRAVLEIFEFNETEKPKESRGEHMQVHKHPISYHPFHSSDGFAIRYKKISSNSKAVLDILQFEEPCNLIGRYRFKP